MTRSPAALSLLLGAIVALMWSWPVHAEAEDVLDGRPKSMVVVGYSTSFMWPDMVQFMLDRHAGERVYHVLNAAVGASPVVRWTEGAKHYDRTYLKMLNEYFGNDATKRGDRPAPTIALCQQSLQGVFETWREGIRNEKDLERIAKGADAFQALAAQLHGDGIEVVYIAAHIFKITMEPFIWNERLALEALTSREIDYIRPGPELWRRTKDSFPEGFSPVDKVHPSLLGARIMAEGWYRTLAGRETKESVIKAMWEHPFEAIGNKEGQRDERRGRRQ